MQEQVVSNRIQGDRILLILQRSIQKENRRKDRQKYFLSNQEVSLPSDYFKRP